MPEELLGHHCNQNQGQHDSMPATMIPFDGAHGAAAPSIPTVANSWTQPGMSVSHEPGITQLNKNDTTIQNCLWQGPAVNTFHIDGMHSNRPSLLHSLAEHGISSNTVTCGLHSQSQHRPHAYTQKTMQRPRLLPYRGLLTSTTQQPPVQAGMCIDPTGSLRSWRC